MNNSPVALICQLCVLGCLLCESTGFAQSVSELSSATPAGSNAPPAATAVQSDEIQSWDYAPYRVEVWLAISPTIARSEPQLARLLEQQLDQIFAATWHVRVRTAPVHLQALMGRDLGSLTYQQLIEGDLVVAMPGSAEGIDTIRTARGAVDRFNRIVTTASWSESVRSRSEASSEASGVPALRAVLTSDGIDGPAALKTLWASGEHAVVAPKELADSLEPQAKQIILPISDQIAELHQSLDKLYLLQVDQTLDGQLQVTARELDILLHFLGEPVTRQGPQAAARIASLAIVDAFAPIVRIEDAERKTARGRLRAGGLTTDPEEPAACRKGDVWQAFVRRDDRLGNPDILQRLDWTLLQATEVDGPIIDFDVFAGRSGGVQGRRNKRTQRLALRVQPMTGDTVIHLHERKDPTAPLVGYKIYEKIPPLDGEMQLVGQTAWDGTIRIPRNDQLLRLFYVKNGSAILARLPLVPGVHTEESAGLQSDDARLRAEAYIRGIENEIVDQVAVRQLLAARIRRRLEQKKFDEAQTLLEDLRRMPTYESLSEQMRRAAAEIESDDVAQQARITKLFADTRQLLVRFITPKLIDDLEVELVAARDGKPRVTSAPPETPQERIPINADPSGNGLTVPVAPPAGGAAATPSASPPANGPPRTGLPGSTGANEPPNTPRGPTEARFDSRPERE